MQKPENAGWLCTVTSKITFVFYVEEKKFFVKRRHQGGGGSKVCMERDKGGGAVGGPKSRFLKQRQL